MLYYFAPTPGAVAADVQVAVNLPQFYSEWDKGQSAGTTVVLSNFADGAFVPSGGTRLIPWRPSLPRKVSGLTPDHAWGAGLSAWRLGDYETAAVYFEALAESERASPWSVSAGAFWAGRSHLFARRPDQVSHWLGIAATHSDTFYGLLARRILGLSMPFRWELDEADQAALQAVNGAPEGKRALALIAAGEYDQAEQELRALVVRGRPELTHGAMIVADNAGMADLAFRLHQMLLPHGIESDGAAYPIPRWRPEGGFSTDRALIYALMRQESNFNPHAVSRAGARGVMQLMPSTARYIARASGFAGSAQLSRPESNIALGEKYLKMLLADENVAGDLFRLAAAWNAGPGNLGRWQRASRASEDPLLFIETIPSGETRAFIEHVLANFWIYRHRLGQPSPSLDALAEGRWPGYDGNDRNQIEIAEHAEN
jgi:soluble lytic murein transglycosylase-like protein